MLPADALNGIRFRTEVDWVKIRVTLSSPSQFRHIQSRLKERFGKTYVTACDGAASSKRFVFNVQNPAGPRQLMRDLQVLVRPGDPAVTETDVEILGIEVALDGYLKGSDRKKLASATAYLAKHLAQIPSGPPRATSHKHFHVPSSPRELQQEIAQGASINMGAMDADFRVRAYVKDYDTIAGNRITLPTERHRARLEITLAGDQLPFRTISEWQDFRFESLSKPRFAICKSVASGELAVRLHERSLMLGRSADAYKIRASDRRKRPALTRRDIRTNDAIRQALESLTKRQSCRNSEKEYARNQGVSEGNFHIHRSVLNTLIENSSSHAAKPEMTCAVVTSPDTEIDSFLSRVFKPSDVDEFETTLPNEWGAW